MSFQRWSLVGIVLIAVAVVVSLLASVAVEARGEMVTLTDDNFDELVSKGEWFVEIYAPWCGMCKKLQPELEKLSAQLESSGNEKLRQVKLGKINTDDSAALSLRFFVTGIPTLYHIKDGECRHYVGGREASTIYQMLEKEEWRGIEKWEYATPFSVVGKMLAVFARYSVMLLNVIKVVQTKSGLPTMAMIGVGAVVAIVLGGVIGLVVNYGVNFFSPKRPGPLRIDTKKVSPPPSPATSPAKKEATPTAKKEATPAAKKEPAKKVATPHPRLLTKKEAKPSTPAESSKGKTSTPAATSTKKRTATATKSKGAKGNDNK